MEWERRWLDIFAEDIARDLAAAEACQIADRTDLAYQGNACAIQARVLSSSVLLTLDPQRHQRDFERFEAWLSKSKKVEAWFKATFNFTRRADGLVEVVQKNNLTIRHVEAPKPRATNKLTDAQRQELTEMVKAGESFSQIAKAYGVSTSTVGYYAGKAKKLNGSTDK